MENKQHIDMVARTFEISKVAEMTGHTAQDIVESTSDDLTLLAGKAAGVCYMPDNYFEEGIQDEEKSMKRALSTAARGHHSVFDHGTVNLVIKTNKMIAMILNSLGCYTTSEKSARYTRMEPETPLESKMYTKWQAKLQKAILSIYPDMDDELLSKRFCKKLGIEPSNAVINGSISHIKDDEYMEEILSTLKKDVDLPSYKLAQENARYMISVFTPTTMEYSISYRQACLIIDYFKKLEKNLVLATDTFSVKLLPYIEEFRELLESIIGKQQLHDTKNQYIRFLEAQHNAEVNLLGDKIKVTPFEDMSEREDTKQTVIGDSYTITYIGSLAMLAQAQRHRTLRYSMWLTEPGKDGFYIPEIVKKAGLEKDWIKDIQNVAYCIPQGTMVRITEQGLFEDFALKCKERMCGRAQLEIMRQTSKLVNLFYSNRDKLCYSNKMLLDELTDVKGKACPRCMYRDYTCTDGCRWKAVDALTRLI